MLAGMMSVSMMVGCSDNTVEEQNNNQMQQEQQVDERYQTKLLIMKDLEFYEEVTAKMDGVFENLESREDYIEAYRIVNSALEELRAYDNCSETTELKRYLENALINSLEGLDCMYQNDVYGAQKALTEFEVNVEKYIQELNRIVEEYSDNSEE